MTDLHGLVTGCVQGGQSASTNICLTALRLYPPIPRNVRTALKDIILPTGGGPDGRSRIFVPAGTEVCYHVYAMHRRFDLWGPDALEFRPERWTDVEPGWSFLPFNGGPRICLGSESLTRIALLIYATCFEVRNDC